MDEYPVPTYATSNYLEWLHPGLDAEKQARQQEIARNMSRMLAESYWRQLRENRQSWENSLKDHTDEADYEN